MVSSRRDFLKTTAVMGGAMGLGAVPVLGASSAGDGGPGGAASPEASPGRASRALRILILGGTGFIGPHEVEYARQRGHEITLFNRGRTAPDLFPNVETLTGDRNGQLEALEGRTWDVVLDNIGSNPEWVRMSGELLQDAAERYMYVSSISAFASMAEPGQGVDGTTFTFESAEVDPATPAGELPYGLGKAESERVVERLFPGRAVIVRPGLIVGPGDRSDRFTYWPARIHRGGEIAAPGHWSDPTQIIDVRDLTQWMIRLLEQGDTGRFNATGHPRPLGGTLWGIAAVTGPPTEFTWLDADFLREHEVRPWSHMPVWIPPEGDSAGFMRFDISRAVVHGLTFRPLAETARDTLEWHLGRPAEERESMRAGLPPEREAELLAAWHARSPM